MLIGKGGETIRNLQFNSGAKIQILKDSEADPNSALRPVEIIGNVLCIDNAEKLINAVIAEVTVVFLSSVPLRYLVTRLSSAITLGRSRWFTCPCCEGPSCHSFDGDSKTDRD